MSNPASTDLEAARTRLTAKGLLQEGDSLSCRLPASGEMLSLVHRVGEPGLVQRTALEQGAAAMPVHALLYAARQDAGAALLARLPWAGALAVSRDTMPGVFDEQLRHLGARVRPIKAIAPAAVADGANAYITPQGVLCIGMTLERLIFNAELLEKCAKAYVLARVSGHAVGTIPWLVRWIATGRLRRDQRRAGEHHARGEAAPRSVGY
ncbi:MAG: hypothetical protein JO006_00995 [Paucibacter sp.]|nr:hypothetical protein [Roseateles sp.]